MTSPVCGASQWLNAEFLAWALSCENVDLNDIAAFSTNRATEPGDNYISELSRVQVKLKNAKTVFMILKCLPTAEYNLKFISDAKIFEKEIKFYTEIKPLMARGALGFEYDKLKLTPKCYCARSDVIVLEDLSAKGYKIANRREGLDLMHCKLVMKNLAVLHARSLTIDSQLLESAFCDTLYSGKSKEHAERYVKNSVKAVAAAVAVWPGFEHYSQKLLNVAEEAHQKVLNIFSKKHPIQVLTHGDFWINNMMFKYREGQPVKVKFLDFQMSRYGSPTLDILYFIYTSIVPSLRCNEKIQVILKEYWFHFDTHLKTLKFQANLTFEEFCEQLDENAFFGFINAVMVLPAILCDPGDVADLGSIAVNASAQKCHHTALFREQFQEILIEFERRGHIK